MPRTIYLIRHAKAGDRGSHGPDDLQRPLTKKGRRQALALADLFQESAIMAVYSSPALRCIQTVEALAESFGLEVQVEAGLVEGSRIKLPDSDGDIVLCAHGDNIPDFVTGLGGAGYRCAKASVWEVKQEADGTLRCGGYREVPHDSADEA